MIKKIYDIFKYYKLKSKLKKYKNNIKIHESAVLLRNFNIDIRNSNIRNEQQLVKIGKESMIDCNIVFEKNSGIVDIGDRTYIGNDTNLISINGIEIGNDVTISWGCTIYDHNSHSIEWEKRKNDTIQSINDYKKYGDFIKNKNWDVVKSQKIKICDKVWIGFDVVILKGVNIGEGAVIGAKSVVTKDVEPYTVVAGNPARVVKVLKR